eukprot:g6607.t1
MKPVCPDAEADNYVAGGLLNDKSQCTYTIDSTKTGGVDISTVTIVNDEIPDSVDISTVDATPKVFRKRFVRSMFRHQAANVRVLKIKKQKFQMSAFKRTYGNDAKIKMVKPLRATTVAEAENLAADVIDDFAKDAPVYVPLEENEAVKLQVPVAGNNLDIVLYQKDPTTLSVKIGSGSAQDIGEDQSITDQKVTITYGSGIVETASCTDNPCEHGTCTDANGTYTCDCAGTGYEGTHCETDINECDQNICQHGGQCDNTNGNYTCDCAGTGYNGARCQQDIDECVTANPCLHDSVCHDVDGSYTCDCANTGYSGTHCETDINECSLNPCQNNAECSNLVNDYSCDCSTGDAGWQGKDCDTSIDEQQCTTGGTMLFNRYPYDEGGIPRFQIGPDTAVDRRPLQDPALATETLTDDYAFIDLSDWTDEQLEQLSDGDVILFDRNNPLTETDPWGKFRFEYCLPSLSPPFVCGPLPNFTDYMDKVEQIGKAATQALQDLETPGVPVGPISISFYFRTTFSTKFDFDVSFDGLSAKAGVGPRVYIAIEGGGSAEFFGFIRAGIGIEVVLFDAFITGNIGFNFFESPFQLKPGIDRKFSGLESNLFAFLQFKTRVYMFGLGWGDQMKYTLATFEGFSSSDTIMDTPVAREKKPEVEAAGVFVGSEDSIISGEITAVDSDGDTLYLSIETPPTRGKLQLDKSNSLSFVYTPDEHWAGIDYFSYHVTDKKVQSESIKATLKVHGVADLPEIHTGLSKGDEDTFVLVQFKSGLIDLDGSESLSVVLSGVPERSTHLEVEKFSTVKLVRFDGGKDKIMNADSNGDYHFSGVDLAETQIFVLPPQDRDVNMYLTATTIVREKSTRNFPAKKETTKTVRNFGVEIIPVNDAPVIKHLPSFPIRLDEDTSIGIDMFVLYDVDAYEGFLNFSMSVSNGVLKLSSKTTTSICAPSKNSSRIECVGTIKELNNVIGGTVYVPNPNYNGEDEVQLYLNDLGNTGKGGALVDVNTLQLIVCSVNDPPTLRNVNGDALTVALSGGNNTVPMHILVDDIDIEDRPMHISLSVLGNFGTLEVLSPAAIQFHKGFENNRSVVQFTGTLTNVQSALRTFHYHITDSQSCGHIVTIKASDNGEIGACGPRYNMRPTTLQIGLNVYGVNSKPVVM